MLKRSKDTWMKEKVQLWPWTSLNYDRPAGNVASRLASACSSRFDPNFTIIADDPFILPNLLLLFCWWKVVCIFMFNLYLLLFNVCMKTGLWYNFKCANSIFSRQNYLILLKVWIRKIFLILHIDYVYGTEIWNIDLEIFEILLS